jgi:hypothetical protein
MAPTSSIPGHACGACAGTTAKKTTLILTETRTMSIGPLEILVILAVCVIPLVVVGLVAFLFLRLRGRPK